MSRWGSWLSLYRCIFGLIYVRHNVQSVYYIISPLSLLSMEGSVCKLPEIVRLKKKYKVHNADIYNAP